MTMGIRGFKTKKELKAVGIGRPARFIETSFFGAEYKGEGTYVVVGPSPDVRTWFASVTVDEDGIITKVK